MCAVLACVVLLLAGVGANAQPLLVMTYNIRLDTAADGEDRWDLRKEGLVSQLKFHEPDVFGIQEGLPQQVAYLDASLPDYDYVGVGRDDGREAGEFSAIFYDARRLALIDDGTFWLSDKPAEPSRGWDAALNRICTYAKFRDLVTRREFWIFNTHFDHVGTVAREKSASLIIEQMQALNVSADPALLMGDFNSEPDSPPIARITDVFDDTRTLASFVEFGPDGTFSGFAADAQVRRRIDYIFASRGGWDVRKYAVIADVKDGRFYSDHLPVLVQISALAATTDGT